jgi:hypothetical protein
MPRPQYYREQFDQEHEASGFQEQIINTPYQHRVGGTHGMDAGIWITVYLTAALVASIVAGIAATAKRRHPGYWLVFSFLCPPLVLILLLLPHGYVPRNIMREPRDDDDSLD